MEKYSADRGQDTACEGGSAGDANLGPQLAAFHQSERMKSISHRENFSVTQSDLRSSWEWKLIEVIAKNDYRRRMFCQQQSQFKMIII